MKLNYKNTLIAAGILCFAVSGCLKDDDFDNQEYGIDIKEKLAVAFPQAADSVIIGAVAASPEPATLQGPFITLEGNGNAASDVSITLVEAPDLVLRHGYEPLPAGSYTVTTLAPVIEAGTRSTDEVKLVLSNSAALDPTLSYAIGFQITAVSSGYQVASNQQYVVLAFSIKNKYDGVYTLRMRHDGWLAYGIAEGVSDEYGEIDLITTSANSVSMFNPARGDNLQPGFTGSAGEITGATAFGAAAPEYVFDNTTNLLTGVNNLEPDDGRGRGFALNPAVTDSRFDEATRNIYLSYLFKQNGRPNLVIYDTLLFVEDRP